MHLIVIEIFKLKKKKIRKNNNNISKMFKITCANTVFFIVKKLHNKSHLYAVCHPTCNSLNRIKYHNLLCVILLYITLLE